MGDLSYAEMGLRLLLSIVFGGFIGLEREAAHKPAGLRTNTLVCLGTTIFMIIALQTLADYPEYPVDPTRIAAGVIVGIGFLGAGTILRTGTGIQGLTSAATIWFVCGIGLATAMGYYLLATMSAILGFMVLRFIPLVEEKFSSSESGREKNEE